MHLVGFLCEENHLEVMAKLKCFGEVVTNTKLAFTDNCSLLQGRHTGFGYRVI
jgi:hypothetical protein